MYRRVGALVAAVAFLVVVFAVSSVSADPSMPRAYLPIVAYPPTLTPTPSPTVTPTPPPSFNDDFSNPNSGWSVGENDIEKTAYVNGEFQIFIKQPNYMVRAGNNLNAGDFQVQADARAAANTNVSYGFYFGYNNGNYYAYQVGQGQYSLLRYDANSKNWTVLINWTSASAIAGGNSSNHLMVTRSGSTISLFANGSRLTQITDSALGAGFVGLAAASFDSNVDARFDNFSLIEAAPQNARQAGAEPTGLDGGASFAKLPDKWPTIPR